MTFAAILFYSAFALCFYVYLGYPSALALIARLHRREVRIQAVSPTVSVIIPAHNEQRIIGRKLDNTVLLHYPPERLEIIVVSDGSTDATESMVRGYAQHGVRLLALPRCGKAVALNQAASQASGEILVFTDANAILDAHALLALVRNFHDPEIGGVCGNQRYDMQDPGIPAGEGENLYWRYDKWIKGLESRLGSTVAADGSLYAIRRSLFVPIADAAQADDLAISARVVTQGFRLIVEPKAISYEDPPSSLEQEFWRKVRVTNHSVRAIMRLAPALRPWRHGEYLIKLLSHKVLRYAVPFLLLIALGSNIALAPTSWFFAVLLGLQLAFYGLAASAYRLRDSKRVRLRLFYIPLYFCLANAAAFLGVLSVLRGDRITVWQPQRDHGNETQEPINIQEYRKRAS